jgi:hypothetical protein
VVDGGSSGRGGEGVKEGDRGLRLDNCWVLLLLLDIWEWRGIS